MATWNIQYENDTYPALQVSGTRKHAEKIAKRRNKYNESYTITGAPKPDYTLAKELAYAEAVKYGCALPPMD